MAEIAVELELEGWSPRNTGYAVEGGGEVVAWVRFSTGGAVTSDRGATLSSIQQPSPGLRLALRALCRTNDVEIDRGELVIHVPPGGDVGEAVDRLGRVCARALKLAR
jgi:hypothetical protein